MSTLLRCVVSKACVAAALFGLTSCAMVDQYSDRAVVYNLQAEQAQEQALLLNIVRASLRRPMQFTGLQSITGTASASGSVTGSALSTSNLPLIALYNLIPPNSSSLLSKTNSGTIGGSATLSGGPTFSVPVLDTQEFYQGFLNPIPGQLLDLYLQYGYPRDVLFNVAIERIIIKRIDAECREERHTPECELIIRNYAPEDVSLELFQGLIGYLIHLGLSTEPIEVKDKKGDKGAAEATSLMKPFGFCFSPRDAASYHLINIRVLCGHPAATLQLQASQVGRKSVINGVHLTREFIAGLYQQSVASRLDSDIRTKGFRSLNAFAGKNVSVSFSTRSIEGILYYLGEVVRRSARPEGGQSEGRVKVRVGPPQNPFPVQNCPFDHGGENGEIDGYRCTDLFVIDEGMMHPAGISVMYQGIPYSISPDTKTAWTLPVFDLVKQLQAVNTSAKQLPASNLISVISNQ